MKRRKMLVEIEIDCDDYKCEIGKSSCSELKYIPRRAPYGGYFQPYCTLFAKYLKNNNRLQECLDAEIHPVTKVKQGNKIVNRIKAIQ